jgi:hypothetical protein
MLGSVTTRHRARPLPESLGFLARRRRWRRRVAWTFIRYPLPGDRPIHAHNENERLISARFNEFRAVTSTCCSPWFDPFSEARCGNTSLSVWLAFPCEPHSRGHGTDARSDIRPSPVHSAQGRADGRRQALAKSARSPRVSANPESSRAPRTPTALSQRLDTRSTSCTRVDLLAFMLTLRAYGAGSHDQMTTIGHGSDRDSSRALE